MKNSFLVILAFIFVGPIYGQIDSVNTKSNSLIIDQLGREQKTYLVYLQDSLNGAKYNFEVWSRVVVSDLASASNTLNWIRHKNNKGSFYQYRITFDDQLRSLSEQIVHQQTIDGKRSTEKTLFTYEGPGIYSSNDTLLHNTKPFKRDSLNGSFNWELDIEILACLPLAQGKTFAINFYHPGSKTPPKYYRYSVDRAEPLNLNGVTFHCWVLKVAYSTHQSCEFWIDMSANTVLQVRDEFFGRYRYKRIVL